MSRRQAFEQLAKKYTGGNEADSDVKLLSLHQNFYKFFINFIQ